MWQTGLATASNGTKLLWRSTRFNKNLIRKLAIIQIKQPEILFKAA